MPTPYLARVNRKRAQETLCSSRHCICRYRARVARLVPVASVKRYRSISGK